MTVSQPTKTFGGGLGILGVTCVSAPKRRFPANNIACNSLGFARFVPKCAHFVPMAPHDRRCRFPYNLLRVCWSVERDRL